MTSLRDLKRAFDTQRDEFNATLEQRLEATKNEFKEDLMNMVETGLQTALTGPEFLTTLRERLGPVDSEASGGARGGKRRRPLKERNLKLEQLVHYHVHAMLKKPHARPSHWPDLPKVPTDIGSVTHWPQPAPNSETQPVIMKAHKVAEANTVVRKAIREGVTVCWPVQQSSSSVVGASPSSTPGIEPSVSVWRPDFTDFKSTSSIAFRNEALSCCKTTVTAYGGPDRQYSDDDILAEIETYYYHLVKEYAGQMESNKRDTKDMGQREGRRKLRASRALKERYDHIDHSPLKNTVNYASIKKALTGPYAWVPDYLSDDDEDRFVKRADFDEREVYYRECVKQPKSYKKSAIWESRDAFWMTKECGFASVILDEFVRKKKASVTPLFRTPYDLAHKDLREIPKWPAIRPKDDVGKPKRQGEGYAIYRFMVDHGRMSSLPGFQPWSDKLYDDPLEHSEPPTIDTTSGLLVEPPTIQAVCGSPEFESLGLWKDAKWQHRQFQFKRVSENELIERYRKLTVQTVQSDEDVDEEQAVF